LSEDLTKKFFSNDKGILNFLGAQDIGRMMTLHDVAVFLEKTQWK
jgi:hypothetical protein